MEWIELKPHMITKVLSQIEEISSNYMNLIKEIKSYHCQSKLEEFNILRDSIEDRIDELDKYFINNFDKPFSSYFEKARIKLKKLLMFEPDLITEVENSLIGPQLLYGMNEEDIKENNIIYNNQLKNTNNDNKVITTDSFDNSKLVEIAYFDNKTNKHNKQFNTFKKKSLFSTKSQKNIIKNEYMDKVLQNETENKKCRNRNKFVDFNNDSTKYSLLSNVKYNDSVSNDNSINENKQKQLKQLMIKLKLNEQEYKRLISEKEKIEKSNVNYK